MGDAAAYMELARANAQGELSALERGMHALGATEKGKHGQSVRSYAEAIGRPERTVSREVAAARVALGSKFAHVGELTDRDRHLVEIHAAPSWLWPALVGRLVEQELTVEATRRLSRQRRKLSQRVAGGVRPGPRPPCRPGAEGNGTTTLTMARSALPRGAAAHAGPASGPGPVA